MNNLHEDPRINEILDFILSLASGKWDIERSSCRDGDELDAIIVGLEMLAEELRYSASQRDMAEQRLHEAHDKLELEVARRTAQYKQAKEEAEQANRLKSEFLTNISHELRTPLHAVLNYAHFGVSKNDTLSRKKSLHYYTQIRKAADRLMKLITDLMDLSKLDTQQSVFSMELTDLKNLAQEIIRELQVDWENKGIAVIFHDPSVPTKLACDIDKMARVIRNLLSNAITYSDKNSTINIQITEGEIQKDGTSQSALKFSLSDQGVGIPEDELDFIFEKFSLSSRTRTGAGGTGLGLPICKEIITGHNGKIHAVNNAAGGSTFCFLLPRDQES